jgi:prepilin-type N-terminal cleavage/methylation domain-containing protein
MKRAFTVIELIFVLIILGILTTLALPNFTKFVENTHESSLKVFTSLLNRVIGPELLQESINNGYNGKISQLTKYDGRNFFELAKVPPEVDVESIKLENCQEEFNLSSPFAKSNEEILKDYFILCKDGNYTSPAKFVLIKDKKCIAGSCEEYESF